MYVMAHDRFHTTVTERGGFRDCRRRWHLETIEHLAHKNAIPWALIFGNAIHEGLAAYYVGNKRNLLNAKDAFNTQWLVERDILIAKYGGLYEVGIDSEWEETYNRGLTMLDYYDIYDRKNPFWDDVIEINVEERSFVPILDMKGAPIAGTPLLSGKIDLVVHKKGSGTWIVDHKTAADAYNARALDVDDQLTGYAYIWWRISGEVPRGALYNALIKDPPKPPRELNDGSLSRAKDQRTTYDLYIAALKEKKINPKLAPEYDDILKYLKNKGWSSFFLRDGLERNLEELESFEWRLYHEYEEMKRALEDEGFRYPNPSQRTCGWCSMIPVCQAMEEGGDPEFVKENMYVEQEPRVTIPEGV